MTKAILFIDCFAGIAGDMMLGALFDLDDDVGRAIERALAALPLTGYRLEHERIHRSGIAARQLRVISDDDAQPERSLKEIVTMIDSATLDDGVKRRAADMFTALGDAEGAVHGVPPERVHFHEVGAVDSIVDIVGVAAGLEHLNARVFCSQVPLGHGFVKCRHGTLPVPAPATMALLEGVPVYGTEVPTELVTPTGAAIVKTQAEGFGLMPPMRPRGTGWGAGARDHDDRPGLLRLVLGEPTLATVERGCVVLEANVDDMTAEIAAHAMEQALTAGALDAWVAPITMKKGRPALQVAILARAVDRDRLAELLMEETTTIGLRFHEVGRMELRRRVIEVQTDYGPLPVKIAEDAGGSRNFAPEFEACRKVALDRGVPLKRVMAAATAAALRVLE